MGNLSLLSNYHKTLAISLSDIITNGKLDSYLVQPKNVLLAAITSDVESSAIGDMIYGYIIMCVSGFTIGKFVLFTLFTICGGLIITSIAVILASLSFWFRRSDMIADSKGITRIILFTIIPVGIINYIPVWGMTEFSLALTIIVIVTTVVSILFAFAVFYKGLRKYSSSNLMVSRI